MNVCSTIVSLSLLVVTVLSENIEKAAKNSSTNDDCEPTLNCGKCVQLKRCQFVHCYNDTHKGLCVSNVTEADLHCEVLVIKDASHCGEETTTTTERSNSMTTQNSSSHSTTSTTAATIPIPSTRDGTGTGKGFSAPSFIGGIVLAFGLMAIAVVVFKFYKARTEANYHTL